MQPGLTGYLLSVLIQLEAYLWFYHPAQPVTVGPYPGAIHWDEIG